jgi:membrane protein required for colicin V production
VRNAKSRIVLENTGEWLQALLPQDMDNYLSQMLKRRKDDEPDTPPEPPRGQRSNLGSPAATGSVGRAPDYRNVDRVDMRQLIDATRR